MTDMTRAPHFFVKPTPSRVEGVEYKPFPAEGEPVYTTHPAFSYDKGLRIALDSYHLTVAISIWKMKEKNPEATVEGEMAKGKMVVGMAWLKGEIPIPENHWELMKETRQMWLTERELPLDSPIGFQHPDFQPSSNQPLSNQPDQPDQPDLPDQSVPPLQAAS